MQMQYIDLVLYCIVTYAIYSTQGYPNKSNTRKRNIIPHIGTISYITYVL